MMVAIVYRVIQSIKMNEFQHYKFVKVLAIYKK